jgi:hypothetical protein
MADISFDYFDHPQNKQVCFVGPFYPTARLNLTLHSTNPTQPWPQLNPCLGHFASFIWHMFPLPRLPPHLTSPHLSPLCPIRSSYSTHQHLHSIFNLVFISRLSHHNSPHLLSTLNLISSHCLDLSNITSAPCSYILLRPCRLQR